MGTNHRLRLWRMQSGLGGQPDVEGEQSGVANVIPSSTQVSFEAHSGLDAFG